MGALLASPQPGYDIDPFDAYCDHLLVREETTGQVVGTYRLLPPERAEVAGRLYAESEFDLAALDAIRPGLVEVGRSCVHPDHRDGAVVGLIWAGIARYMTERGHEWLAGCCSVPLADGGALAAGTWNRVGARAPGAGCCQVGPLGSRGSLAAPSVPAGRTELPALLRGYLRLGAWVYGEPAHDVDFGVADLAAHRLLLPMNRVDPRYLLTGVRSPRPGVMNAWLPTAPAPWGRAWSRSDPAGCRARCGLTEVAVLLLAGVAVALTPLRDILLLVAGAPAGAGGSCGPPASGCGSRAPPPLRRAAARCCRLLARRGRRGRGLPRGQHLVRPGAGRFRRAVFQAALDAGVPVQPVRIGYRGGSGR